MKWKQTRRQQRESTRQRSWKKGKDQHQFLTFSLSTLLWISKIFERGIDQDQFKTLCEILWWKQSQRWTKMKVVKWCWNKWNGHILVHIYHKQCEFIQKIRWKGSNGQLQWFNKATSGALCWKRQKNTKTRGTKTQITQNFEKVWPI